VHPGHTLRALGGGGGGGEEKMKKKTGGRCQMLCVTPCACITVNITEYDPTLQYTSYHNTSFINRENQMHKPMDEADMVYNKFSKICKFISFF
jgi:hypothetical protein